MNLHTRGDVQIPSETESEYGAVPSPTAMAPDGHKDCDGDCNTYDGCATPGIDGKYFPGGHTLEASMDNRFGFW